MEITLHLSYLIPYIVYFAVNAFAMAMQTIVDADRFKWTKLSDSIGVIVLQSLLTAALAGTVWWLIWMVVF